MSYVLAFLLGFLSIVFVHELGHFIAAKKLGIKVLEFSIFIGPKIYSFKRGETTYTIRLIPILAYVKLEGEEEASDSDAAYYRKPKYARILTSAGGPLANILLAIILLTAVFSIQGFDSARVGSVDAKSPAAEAGIRKGDTVIRYNGKRVYTMLDVIQFLYIEKGAPATLELMRGSGATFTAGLKPLTIPPSVSYKLGVTFKTATGSDSNLITSISPGYPAEAAGLKPDDRIIGLDGTEITSRDDIIKFMEGGSGQELKVTVLRSGKEAGVSLKPKAEKVPEQYDMGLHFSAVKGTIFDAFRQSVIFSYSIVRSVGYSLVWLVTGKASLSQMMGPIGMVSSIGSVVQQAPNLLDKLLNLFNMTALMSIAVGATNLIPFPMLDGNRILLVLIEAVRGKPIPLEKEAYISMVGFVLLILLAIYVGYNDIVRLVTG